MRLINVESLKLHEFFGARIPSYAILSHTWEIEEATFQERESNTRAAQRKAGHRKVTKACFMAKTQGYEWLWVDTNCIDKNSSAELSEAINSMFAWYANAEICFAYLADVPTGKLDNLGQVAVQVRASRWFTRGWTLQELLAPKTVVFCAADWSSIGTRGDVLTNDLVQATGIHSDFLTGKKPIARANVATKFSWVSQRVTTREEDIAYCMLGIFDINMPLLYGEGSKAFNRLQEEIIKVSNDMTIFSWPWDESMAAGWTSLLAPSPSAFQNWEELQLAPSFIGTAEETLSFHMTNAGLSIRRRILAIMTGYIIGLATEFNAVESMQLSAWIPVRAKSRYGTLLVRRHTWPPQPLTLSALFTEVSMLKKIVVRRQDDLSWDISHGLQKHMLPSSNVPQLGRGFRRVGVFPLFSSEALRYAWIEGDWNITLAENRDIMWFNSIRDQDTEMAEGTVELFIRRPTQGNIWLTIWVGAAFDDKAGKIHWSCRVLSQNDPSPRYDNGALRSNIRKVAKYVLQEEERTETWENAEGDLNLVLGDYAPVSDGHIRYLLIWSTVPN
ncbi:vegetative incompatibility protein HET-E-1 [Colletotrichum musicola]|uniref:Vegetative incompatibility protein HET-E-1 n=1 Tax=Colletotrichum musicola TaxID=2175873 RepID=A0A8H6K1H2_9PEZI|nr:vegetative incompatibility protein HET-E-1 [Colletotrichum musicola]